MKKGLDGRVTIGYTHAYPKELSAISLRLIDAASGTIVVELQLSMIAWAEALSNLGDRPCSFTLFDNEMVGWHHEHRDVIVPDLGTKTWPMRHKMTVNFLRSIGDPWLDVDQPTVEFDYHTGGDEERLNRHNVVSIDGVHGYRVTLHRWVPPVDDDTTAYMLARHGGDADEDE